MTYLFKIHDSVPHSSPIPRSEIELTSVAARRCQAQVLSLPRASRYWYMAPSEVSTLRVLSPFNSSDSVPPSMTTLERLLVKAGAVFLRKEDVRFEWCYLYNAGCAYV